MHIYAHTTFHFNTQRQIASICSNPVQQTLFKRIVSFTPKEMLDQEPIAVWLIAVRNNIQNA